MLNSGALLDLALTSYHKSVVHLETLPFWKGKCSEETNIIVLANKHNSNPTFLGPTSRVLMLMEGDLILTIFNRTGTQSSLQKIPFLATLNLPYLSKLINDPIRHLPTWPPIPTKLPSNISKFEGKVNKDPNTHIMTIHLWCSLNSLMDDSVRLRLFQRTLMGVAAKWYIKFPTNSFVDFGNLSNAFLHHFQLPIRYDFGTELLTSFQQGDTAHISDHIH